MRRQQHEVEAVGDCCDAVVDSDASHGFLGTGREPVKIEVRASLCNAAKAAARTGDHVPATARQWLLTDDATEGFLSPRRRLGRMARGRAIKNGPETRRIQPRLYRSSSARGLLAGTTVL